ncbi:MAG: HNH endonuclease [Thermoleophilia bacterium]
MSKSDKPQIGGQFEEWGDRINWKVRVKAVCKPCWELKYCPYGPLVEEFPLKEDGDDRSCRIFGHDCPVFTMAEPLTETKELRRITRSIPRPVQFRVLKRDNQICRECGKSVQDEDVHFDHIIPWSKGGPTEEHNIRLLCSKCNRKKSDTFEDLYLVKSFVEHVVEPIGFDFMDFMRVIAADAHNYQEETGALPDAATIADWFEVDVSDAEESFARDLVAIDEFLRAGKPHDWSANKFAALRWRWGWHDDEPAKVSVVATECDITADELLEAESELLARLGYRVGLSGRDRKKWLKS